MLHLVQSNQLEVLAEHLLEVLADPGKDPLVPETVVVQNTGMARWLSQRIATRTGISANIDFPLPARFIWEIFAGQPEVEESQPGLDRGVLIWNVLALLQESRRKPAYARISSYLGDDPDGLKSFHLAGKITDIFDQYQVYRPGMLLQWEDGQDSGWQADLWRNLTKENGEHRARLLWRLGEMIRSGRLQPDSLPHRFCLFGISTLAPAYLEIIHGLSQVTDVHMFHLSPCRHYWADLASGLEMAKKRRSWRRQNLGDVSSYFDEGNPLLASLGQIGREFAHQLAEFDFRETACYAEPAGESILARIQADILDLHDPTAQPESSAEFSSRDRSLQFHSCYSRLREVQVLHDRLLELFETCPDITPGDILVMAPDIEQYTSSVRAVFGGGAKEHFIPWSLADLAVRSEQPLAEAFLNLFTLAAGRATAPEVQAILETEAVRRRFEIDAGGLHTIRRWLRESGIRWGFDHHHREEHDLSMSDLHSWSFGLKRLFLGYFSGPDAPLFREIAPCGSLTSEEAELLGRLTEFLDRLQQCCRDLLGFRTAEEWGELLLGLLDDFFAPGDNEEDQAALGYLRDAVCRFLDETGAAAYDTPLSNQVVQSYFTQVLSVPAGGHSTFLGGRVTICNMVPMRSIPFAVICLLGMNDTDYPRSQKKVSFDMMAASPLPGDRNRRLDDRYLFLEALLSARQVLYLSWVGNDQQDNSVRAPSVVVSELRDYVERGYGGTGDSKAAPLVQCHPFQPFNRRCFTAGSPSWSYAESWLPGQDDIAAVPFIRGPLPEADSLWRTVDLETLKTFWSHPVRFFLRERLGMKLYEEDETLPETEPFSPDFLASYHLMRRLVAEKLAGSGEENLFRRMRAEGLLPHGAFGDNVYRDLDEKARELVQTLAPFDRGKREPLEIELLTGDFRVTGWLTGLVTGGCLRFRPARLKGRDLIRLWIDHLVLSCLTGPGEEAVSCHAATDGMTRLRRVDKPLAELQKLLALYWQGMQEPIHFFPETAMAWFEAGEENRWSRASAVWNGGFKSRGEKEDSAYQVVFRDLEPLDESFAALAETVLEPLYRHREDC